MKIASLSPMRFVASIALVACSTVAFASPMSPIINPGTIKFAPRTASIS